jgi:hypothetical protein
MIEGCRGGSFYSCVYTILFLKVSYSLTNNKILVVMLALDVDKNNCIICGVFRSWFAAWGDANLCCNSKVAFYFAYAYVWRVLSADDIELKVCVLECRNQ